MLSWNFEFKLRNIDGFTGTTTVYNYTGTITSFISPKHQEAAVNIKQTSSVKNDITDSIFY